VYGWELFGYRSIRQGEWKLVWDQALPPEQRRWQLFDLAADRAEQHDLAVSEPARFAQLQRAWDRYAQDNGVIY
jgi:arylsulfatase